MDYKKLKNLLDTFLTLQVTKELPRQGFINFGFKRADSDSVAAHSFTVSSLAFFLALSLKKSGYDISPDKTIKIALIHDMGEAISGDIGYHVKRIAGPALRKVEDQTFALLVSRLEIKDEITSYFDEYNEAKSAESKLVKLADVLDAYTQMLLTPGARILESKEFFKEKRVYFEDDEIFGDELVQIFDHAVELLSQGKIQFLS